mgnify:CR=1 FL=1
MWHGMVYVCVCVCVCVCVLCWQARGSFVSWGLPSQLTVLLHVSQAVDRAFDSKPPVQVKAESTTTVVTLPRSLLGSAGRSLHCGGRRHRVADAGSTHHPRSSERSAFTVADTSGEAASVVGGHDDGPSIGKQGGGTHADADAHADAHADADADARGERAAKRARKRGSMWALSAGALKPSQVSLSQLPEQWDKDVLLSQSAFNTEVVTKRRAPSGTKAPSHDDDDDDAGSESDRDAVPGEETVPEPSPRSPPDDEALLMGSAEPSVTDLVAAFTQASPSKSRKARGHLQAPNGTREDVGTDGVDEVEGRTVAGLNQAEHEASGDSDDTIWNEIVGDEGQGAQGAQADAPNHNGVDDRVRSPHSFVASDDDRFAGLSECEEFVTKVRGGGGCRALSITASCWTRVPTPLVRFPCCWVGFVQCPGHVSTLMPGVKAEIRSLFGVAPTALHGIRHTVQRRLAVLRGDEQRSTARTTEAEASAWRFMLCVVDAALNRQGGAAGAPLESNASLGLPPPSSSSDSEEDMGSVDMRPVVVVPLSSSPDASTRAPRLSQPNSDGTDGGGTDVDTNDEGHGGNGGSDDNTAHHNAFGEGPDNGDDLPVVVSPVSSASMGNGATLADTTDGASSVGSMQGDVAAAGDVSYGGDPFPLEEDGGMGAIVVGGQEAAASALAGDGVAVCVSNTTTGSKCDWKEQVIKYMHSVPQLHEKVRLPGLACDDTPRSM